MKENREHGNIYSSMQYVLGFNFPRNVKILDIGCGYGSLIYLLYKRGFKNVWGIDINKKAIEIGKEKYPEIKKRINYYHGNKIPFNNESFDIVTMFDVIEHIPNIEKFLKEEVYRILKKRGFFIFQTPNLIIDTPFRIVLFNSLNKWKQPGLHCSLQTLWSLKKLLEKSGFNSIKIHKYNILTDYNIKKLRKRFGDMGPILLKLFSFSPLFIFPNLWGHCKKQ